MPVKAEFNYSAIPPGYYDLVHNRNGGVHSTWHRAKFSFVSQLIAAKGKHLDIGCGPGTFIGGYLADNDCLGIDIDERQIHWANAHHGRSNARFLAFDGYRLPFADASFDSISLIEVIEHLTDETIASLLGESRRCLKPGGHLVVTTPNYRSPWPLLELIINRFLPVGYDEQHINKFTPSGFRHHLEKYGFSTISSGTFMFSGSFIAALSPRLAKRIIQLENHYSSARWQLLLYGVFAAGKKPPHLPQDD